MPSYKKKPAPKSKPVEKKIWVGDDVVINRHFALLTRLLAEEHKLDQKRFREEILNKKPEDQEKGGKALLHLDLAAMHFTPSGQRLLSFQYANRRPLPRYSLNVGDVVYLSGFQTPEHDRPVGTVYERDFKQITVSFQYKIPTWVGRDKAYHLSQAQNITTFARMFEALKEVGSAKHSRAAYFRDLSLGLKKPQWKDPVKTTDLAWTDPKLNSEQKTAVCKAIQAEDIFLIHGPPGTGKTRVLVEIIAQARKQGMTVLASAPSNTACDNIVEALIQQNIAVTRIGHPARVSEAIRNHTLGYKLSNHAYGKQIDKNESRLEQLARQRERRQDRRVMSWDEKKTMREEVRALRDDNRQLKAHIFKEVWNDSDVVVTTHILAADPIVKSKRFDWIILDEATQSVEPAAWIPIARGEKLVMAGDHHQLPPTVMSSKTGKASLRFTLFERFYEALPEETKVRLETQYRMHETIMSFSSKEFYDSQLRADKSVKKHCLSELVPNVQTKDLDDPFIYIDTAGMGYEESFDPSTGSYYNESEATLILREYRALTDAGLAQKEIAIISPYRAQVKLVSNLLFGSEDRVGYQDLCEVNSIDAFQGREKEAVLVSLVRSNEEGKIGFLSDTRRMNVALTRAKRKLIVVGDSATISNHPFYEDFIKYTESVKAYRSGWEWA